MQYVYITDYRLTCQVVDVEVVWLVEASHGVSGVGLSKHDRVVVTDSRRQLLKNDEYTRIR